MSASRHPPTASFAERVVTALRTRYRLTNWTELSDCLCFHAGEAVYNKAVEAVGGVSNELQDNPVPLVEELLEVGVHLDDVVHDEPALPVIPTPTYSGADQSVMLAGEPPGLTELGNAERLIGCHGADLRYDLARGAWRTWDGRRWALDSGELPRRWMGELAKALLIEAADIHDPAAQSAQVRWALRSQARSVVDNSLSLAQSLAGVGVGQVEWDADPWALNCENGTIDLRTGQLREHRRRDLVTRLAPVDFHPTGAAKSDAWEKFLAAAVPDPEVREFLQRAVGYSLTGDTREEKLLFIHGPAAAGKSTFLETVRAVLGDYATTADFETFIRRPAGGGPRNDIARLAGARLVVGIEVQQGAALAEGLVKTLTGGDTVAARFLYGETFEFRPTFKLWLAANDAPRVSAEDTGVWRRILRVPFDHVVPPERRDPGLKPRLLADRAAVLAWAVQGCLAWQKTGLNPPAAVLAATEEYRESQDDFGEFLADCCELVSAGEATPHELKTAFDRWNSERGAKYSIGPRTFAERLKARGVEPGRNHNGRFWRGIRLLRSVTP